MMTSPVRIERFQPSAASTTAAADVKRTVMEVQVESYGEHDGPELCDLDDIDGVYQSKVQGGFWLARLGEDVVGTIALKVATNEADVATLKRFYVLAAYRNSAQPTYNTAAALLHAVVEHAQRNGVRHIYLGTTPEPPAAVHFFRKNGFVEVPRERLPRGCVISEYDSLFFVRTLVA